MKRSLLASMVLPAFALGLPTLAAAAERQTAIVIAQQDANPEHKPDPKPDPKKPPAQPKPQAPAAQQPAKPSAPAAQQPVTTPPTAQPAKPTTTPTARQPATVPPSAQQPATAPVPPTAQPAKPVKPATPPTAQQPVTTPVPPTAGQPAKPASPPSAQQPSTTPAPSTAQPATPAAPPSAQQRGNPPAATAQPSTAPAQPAPVVAAPRDRQQVIDSQKRADEWRTRRVQDVRDQRREVVEDGRTVIHEPGRTIIVEAGRPIIRHSEVDRFGFGARDVQVEQRGSETITIVERPDGTRIVTVVDRDGRLLRRLRRDRDGRDIVIIDNPLRDPRRVDFYVDLPPPVVRIPRERYIVEAEGADEAAIYDAFTAPPVERIERRYSLDEVRFSERLLERMPRVDIDTVTFDTGSWEVTADQAGRLAMIAAALNRAITRSPQEVFLIEGHTDAVGSDVDNLSLSDRRAEAVAMVLTQQFQVPAENMATQGYGKQYLKIPTDGPERRNRRVTIRRVTPLLTGQAGPQSN